MDYPHKIAIEEVIYSLFFNPLVPFVLLPPVPRPEKEKFVLIGPLLPLPFCNYLKSQKE